MTTRWLPNLPIEAVDASIVEAFLLAAHDESTVVEYKVSGDSSTLPEDVAAMANTYGGVIIVGVPDEWTGDLNTLTSVSPDIPHRLTDRLVDVLDPPWVPPMKAVTVAGRNLLVIRITVDEAPRPVLCSQKAIARHGARNGPLARQALEALFAGGAPCPVSPNLGALHASSTDMTHARFGDSQPQILLRIASGVPTWPGQVSTATPTSALRSELRDVAASTPLSMALRQTAERYGCTEPSVWEDVGPANSRTMSFGLRLTRQVRGRQLVRVGAHLLVTWGGLAVAAGGGIASELDVALWPRDAAQDAVRLTGRPLSSATPFTVKTDELRALLEGMVASTTESLHVATAHLCGDVRPLQEVGPIGWVTAVADLADFLDLSDVSARRLSVNQLGTVRPLTPWRRGVRSGPDVEAIVTQWMRELTTDLGFEE